jgi:hypothetical protein
MNTAALIAIHVAAARWYTSQRSRGYRLLARAGRRLATRGFPEPLNQTETIRALLADPASRGAARRAYRVLFRNRDLL